MQAADYFRQIPLFADLAPDEIVDVLRIARVVTFAPGKLICARGERGECAYVIEHGEAAVRAIDESGKHFVIAQVGPGEVVGELSLVDGHPRSADVFAVTEVRGYRIDRAELDALRRAMHPAVFKIMRRIAITVSDRLRDVNDALASELARGGASAPGKPAARKTQEPAPRKTQEPAARATKAPSRSSTGETQRTSRAAMRASRDFGRVSVPPPARASAPQGGAAVKPSTPSRAPSTTGPTRASRVAAPTAARAVQPASAAPAAEPTSVWRSMLKRLGGAPWK